MSHSPLGNGSALLTPSAPQLGLCLLGYQPGGQSSSCRPAGAIPKPLKGIHCFLVKLPVRLWPSLFSGAFALGWVNEFCLIFILSNVRLYLLFLLYLLHFFLDII